jgi:hypothetical protein
MHEPAMYEAGSMYEARSMYEVALCMRPLSMYEASLYV